MRLVEIDDYTEVYTTAEFSDLAECGAVGFHEGRGYPAKYVDNLLMEDTSHSCWNYPHGFTHITWYSK